MPSSVDDLPYLILEARELEPRGVSHAKGQGDGHGGRSSCDLILKVIPRSLHGCIEVTSGHLLRSSLRSLLKSSLRSFQWQKSGPHEGTFHRHFIGISWTHENNTTEHH